MVVLCTRTHIEVTLYTIAQLSPRAATTEIVLCRKVKHILVMVVCPHPCVVRPVGRFPEGQLKVLRPSVAQDRVPAFIT